jgi:hypothetical protein
MKSTYFKTAALAGAIVIAGTVASIGSASAEGSILTPWEEFCLLTADDGPDLADCLNGLPVHRTVGGFAVEPADSDSSGGFRFIAR